MMYADHDYSEWNRFPQDDLTWDGDLIDYSAVCPVDGEMADYCQGHGLIGDPVGHRIMWQHDNDDHSGCHPAADCGDLGEGFGFGNFGDDVGV